MDTQNKAPRQTIQEQYQELWDRAWTLADYVDGDTAPIEDRRAKLPELIRMRDKLAEIEKAGSFLKVSVTSGDEDKEKGRAWCGFHM